MVLEIFTRELTRRATQTGDKLTNSDSPAVPRFSFVLINHLLLVRIIRLAVQYVLSVCRNVSAIAKGVTKVDVRTEHRSLYSQLALLFKGGQNEKSFNSTESLNITVLK